MFYFFKTGEQSPPLPSAMQVGSNTRLPHGEDRSPGNLPGFRGTIEHAPDNSRQLLVSLGRSSGRGGGSGGRRQRCAALAPQSISLVLTLQLQSPALKGMVPALARECVVLTCGGKCEGWICALEKSESSYFLCAWELGKNSILLSRAWPCLLLHQLPAWLLQLLPQPFSSLHAAARGTASLMGEKKQIGPLRVNARQVGGVVWDVTSPSISWGARSRGAEIQQEG